MTSQTQCFDYSRLCGQRSFAAFGIGIAQKIPAGRADELSLFLIGRAVTADTEA